MSYLIRMRMNCYKIKIYCFRKAVIMSTPPPRPVPPFFSPLQAGWYVPLLCLGPFHSFWNMPQWQLVPPQSLWSPPSPSRVTYVLLSLSPCHPTPNKTQIHPFIFMPNKKQKFYAISWSSTVVFLTILLACGHQRLLESVQVDIPSSPSSTHPTPLSLPPTATWPIL